MKKLEEITGENIFLICPVREADIETKKFLENYITQLEKQGNKVYYPARDTNQNDPIGLNICSQNREGIKNSTMVHIYFDKTSQGSLFDLGMTFAMEKPIYLVNGENLQLTEKKSFQNVLITLHEYYQK